MIKIYLRQKGGDLNLTLVMSFH